jgi:IS4 transposase
LFPRFEFQQLKHLGISAPSHSTLAYANEHRPWELYQQVFLNLFEHCRIQVIGKKTFRFKNKLISNDGGLWGRWTAQGVYGVTRMKENALYDVVGERKVPQNRNILKDELIELKVLGAIEKSPYPLRRIEVYDPEKNEILVFLTDNLRLGAATIAAIYKDCWQIELFFKALKQNLKIKTFVGTSPNAVKIQSWTAVILHILWKYSVWDTSQSFKLMFEIITRES